MTYTVLLNIGEPGEDPTPSEVKALAVQVSADWVLFYDNAQSTNSGHIVAAFPTSRVVSVKREDA